MKLLNMLTYIAMYREFTLAILHWTLEQLPFMGKKMPIEMIFSPVTRSTIIHIAGKRSLHNEKTVNHQ